MHGEFPITHDTRRRTSEPGKLRGKPFEPGNRQGKGRPLGSRNKRTRYQEMLDEYGEPLLKKTLKMAFDGDRGALKLAVERLLPPAQNEDTILLDGMPPIRSAADASRASAMAIDAALQGKITLCHLRQFVDVIQAHVRLTRDEDLDRRLTCLEQRGAALPGAPSSVESVGPDLGGPEQIEREGDGDV